MPNHVSHKLTYRYEEDQYPEMSTKFAKILEFMKTEYSDFDFNQLIPMPEELRHTSSPTTIVPEEKYKQECEAVDKHNADPKNAHWKRNYPLTQKMRDDYKAKFGADNWYDWAIAHWDTKWNAYTLTVDSYEVTFQTAWSYPRPIFEALSKKFPEMTFEIEYADEDAGRNCGKTAWKNGVEIERMDDDTEPNYPWHEFANRLYFEVELNREREENRELRDKLSKLEEKSSKKGE